MEIDKKTSNIEALSIDKGEINDGQNQDTGVTSAHTIGHDSWQQIGLMLVTSFNCGYILSFSNLMLVPLGWTWGIVSLVVVGFYTAYASWLLAGFHFINGRRFIRYRDLMGYIYGREMYYATWILQFLTLFLLNTGFILLGGRALKEINLESGRFPLRLQYLIIIAGVAYFIFAFFIPTMSAMRIWLGASTIITSLYIAILTFAVVKDGKSNTKKDNGISGSKVDKIFNGLGAISAIIVCNTCGMIPELQSTLSRPAVQNMRKALYVQFTVGLMFYYGVSIVGYWAYGSSVSWYLPNELSGPKWVKILINTLVFLQSVISQNMFAAPIHEALDTKFLKLDESMYSEANAKRRALLRAIFFAVNTFISAAFPFIGDFVNFFGSLALVPLTFVFPSMIFVKLKGKTATVEKNLWHWFNIILFSLLGVSTTTSAVRLIVNNIQQYSFFADT